MKTTQLPKLLTNTMNKRNHKDTITNDNDGGSGDTRRMKISAIYEIILPKKVCSYIRNALRRKKSSSSSEGEERIHSNTCYENNECVDERESPNLEEVHADEGSMVEENRNGSSEISFINSWEQQKTDDDQNKSTPQLKNVSPAAAKQTPMHLVLFPFSGILCEKLSKAGSRKLARVPSMRFNRFRREPPTQEKTSKQEPEAEAEEIERREELCKKRILMGWKCRPLNVSGSLHYDSEGILVPEEIHSCED